MLIEQAFFNLPEILVGSGYAKQEYEAAIVTAFSLAVLQELNGRNAPNPISLIIAEKRFSRKLEKLRADLHVRLDKLYVGSKAFSDFGFRYRNWIEAKFFRTGKGTPPSTQNLGQVAADLIRLVALIPIEKARDKHGNPTDQTITGRYFLHVYLGDPLEHLNPVRKSPKPGQNATRLWVPKLLAEGEQTLDGLELVDESKAFFTHLGKGLETLTSTIRVKNLKIAPRNPTDGKVYTFVLTRIDEATTAFNGRTFTFTSDRRWQCQPNNGFDLLRNDIASHIKPKKATTAAAAIGDDADDEEDDGGQEANPAHPEGAAP